MGNKYLNPWIKRTIFIYLLVMNCGVMFLHGQNLQIENNLSRLLQGKTNFEEIVTIGDQYFRSLPKTDKENEREFEPKETHWERWKWYMSGRLDSAGYIVNISDRLMKAMREVTNMPVPDDRNINSAWTFVGPSTSPLQNNNALFNGIGRVDRIIFHPTNPSIIYIGTPAGGMWNTLNDGLSWNNLTDKLPGTGISGMAINPLNTSTMYLLTGDGDGWFGGIFHLRESIGVLKTIDGGVSWHQTGNFPNTVDPFVGFKLVQSPTDTNILLAATNAGLYRTINGGNTWTKVVNDTIFDVEFQPGSGSRVYATAIGDFYLSTNAGFTWSDNSTFDIELEDCTGVPYGGRVQVAVAPSNPTKVYLLSGPTGSGAFCGLWLSTDNGNSFTRQSWTPNILGSSDWGSDDGGQTYYDLALAVRSDNSFTILTGGLTVWRSDNEGETWTHLTSYNEDGLYDYIHPDIHDIAYNPLNHDVYVANDGGLYKSTDHGDTWLDLSPNIETSMFYHMRGWDGNINKLMGGLQDNGIKYRAANSSAFYHISGADGFDVCFNPNTGEPGYSTINKSVFRYSGNGANEHWIPCTEDSLWFKSIAVHNTNPDTMLVGTNDIHRSFDAGENYFNEGASGSWALTSCPSNNSRFYSAGGAAVWSGTGSLYFSSDIGNTWTVKSNTPGFPSAANYTKITDVTVRPNNSSTVWASFGGFNATYKVVMSTNTGDSWTNMTANLPNVPVNCLAIDNDNGVYVGTDIGIFYRSASMSNWMPWSNGMPNVPVTDLYIFDDGTNKRIRAATFGRGVWQSNLASTCDAAIVVTGSLEGINHFEASSTLTSSSFIQGGIGTFVSFKSGSYITLTEGFNVIDDSEFLGFISPCGEGGIPNAQGDIINRDDPNSSIILLRRIWDPETEMPYGSIDDISIHHNTANVTFKTRKPGAVQIYLAKAVQETLVPVVSKTMDAGKHQIDIDISSMPDELHYLLLFYEGNCPNLSSTASHHSVRSANLSS